MFCNLEYYRTRAGLSRRALASFVGVTSEAIRLYENGSCFPRGIVAERLCVFFGIKISDLICVGRT